VDPHSHEYGLQLDGDDAYHVHNQHGPRVSQLYAHIFLDAYARVYHGAHGDAYDVYVIYVQNENSLFYDHESLFSGCLKLSSLMRNSNM
jgi:hypothetical protein